jgi:hypothetical protein
MIRSACAACSHPSHASAIAAQILHPPIMATAASTVLLAHPDSFRRAASTVVVRHAAHPDSCSACRHRLHHTSSPRAFAHVAKCFKMFQRYVQVFHWDIAKVDLDVACVAMATRMVQVSIQNVLSISDVCCKCFF